MSKTPSTETIVKTVLASPDTKLDSAEGIADALAVAARLGKISGLRKARKLARRGEGVEESIKRTYQALGVDTDAYEAEQAQKRQAYLDAALSTVAYEAGRDTFDGFAGMDDVTVPRVVKDTPQA